MLEVRYEVGGGYGSLAIQYYHNHPKLLQVKGI